MPEGRVLVVEDETIVAMDLAATLRRLGYTVAAVVASGEAAVEIAPEVKPDVVLMDVRLQGAMDGIEAARLIHERHDIPIVFLTAHADIDTVERSKSSAPYGYLIKPFDDRDLPRAIDLALQRRRDEKAKAELVQDALWDSEERFRLIVDSLNMFGFSIIDLSGVIVSWSKGAEEITGFKANEVIGRPLTAMIPEESRTDAMFAEEMQRLTAGELIEFEAWRVRKDGSRYLVHIFRRAIRDRAGRVRGIASIARDITEQRALEEHVREAEKLENLGKLAGGIAHDFNNMLMVIFSRTELLLRMNGDTEPQRRYLVDIKNAANKNRDLTQQILAAARKQVLKPQATNLNDVVSSTMQLLRASIGEDISIRSDLQGDLWQVFADAGKLHQVLMNLTLNARDAMPRGGALTIETRNYRASDAYARLHPQIPEGDYVVLLVSDNGEGMSPDTREHIFDPFFTTKSTGTGLGLAVVRGIVEQTGGRIWVYSEPGQGTAFKIFFPRHLARGAAGAEAAAPEELPLIGGHETILLVEDEQLLRTIIRETLVEYGYHVIEAATPAEALRLSATAGTIDLLLTDVIMPGMNGRDLADRLLSAYPTMNVVFMSGYTDEAVVHQGVLDPGVRFLEKPAPTSVLLDVERDAFRQGR
jgi:PAS domain S-box-containing protein